MPENMPDTYTARCLYCDWGVTHEQGIVVEDAQAHVEECPGPVVALVPRERLKGGNCLRFWSLETRCGGCGMPTALCLCVPAD